MVELITALLIIKAEVLAKMDCCLAIHAVIMHTLAGFLFLLQGSES